MGRIISITEKRRFRANQRITDMPKPIKIGPISLRFVFIILAVVLTSFYFASKLDNSITAKKTKVLEEQKQELTVESERLSVEAARLQSLSQVEQGAGKLGLVPVTEMQYSAEVNSNSIKP